MTELPAVTWPLVALAVLALDAYAWYVTAAPGDTLSERLAAWVHSGPYPCVWFGVAWAWFGVHIVYGIGGTDLFIGLVAATVAVWTARKLRV